MIKNKTQLLEKIYVLQEEAHAVATPHLAQRAEMVLAQLTSIVTDPSLTLRQFAEIRDMVSNTTVFKLLTDLVRAA